MNRSCELVLLINRRQGEMLKKYKHFKQNKEMGNEDTDKIEEGRDMRQERGDNHEIILRRGWQKYTNNQEGRKICF